MATDAVTLEKKGNIAIIKLNKPSKLNAMSSEDWFNIAVHMYDVAADDNITITVLTGEGRFFSAYVHSPFLFCLLCGFTPPMLHHFLRA
jgi:peroxisomal 3,2-trans-enoyl-CoA isomerase